VTSSDPDVFYFALLADRHHCRWRSALDLSVPGHLSISGGSRSPWSRFVLHGHAHNGKHGGATTAGVPFTMSQSLCRKHRVSHDISDIRYLEL
jgi:hypothetical protein